jgi:hypothetical protein
MEVVVVAVAAAAIANPGLVSLGQRLSTSVTLANDLFLEGVGDKLVNLGRLAGGRFEVRKDFAESVMHPAVGREQLHSRLGLLEQLV